MLSLINPAIRTNNYMYLTINSMETCVGSTFNTLVGRKLEAHLPLMFCSLLINMATSLRSRLNATISLAEKAATDKGGHSYTM